jgi:hypothetical protein
MNDQQARFLTALEELKLDVNNSSTVPDAVPNACKSALQGIDELINGVALSMQNPAFLQASLAGISLPISWSLGPNTLTRSSKRMRWLRKVDY